MPGKVSYIVNALRGKEKGKQPPPDVMPTKTRGYQLYKEEATLNGETPMSYEAWLKQATPLDAPQ